MKLNKQSILCSLQQMKIAVRLNKKQKQKTNEKILKQTVYTMFKRIRIYIYI